MKNQAPPEVWRVSIYNQIFFTAYYICRKYVRAKNGGWKPTKEFFGSRFNASANGPYLAMSFGNATHSAATLNRILGWTADIKTRTKENMPRFKVYCD
jgi:hypothetical protein